MQFFQILCFSAVIFTVYVDAIRSCNRSTIQVAVNSTSFPCPVNVNCLSMTLTDLIVSKPSKSPLHKICRNEFIFQSGTHFLETVVQGSLLFAASTDLFVWGQENVTIVCADKTVIDITASNITISDIQFWNCRRVLVTTSKLTYSNVEIANSNFTASHLRMSGAGSETLVVIMRNIYFNNVVLTLTKAHYIDVTGHGSPIICVNAKLNVDVLAPGINVSNIKVQGCNNINVRSKSKRVPFEINNTWFSNSCLNFHTNRTKSDVLIIMKMTKFEQCSCKCIQFFNKVGVIVNITLDLVIVRDNLLPFIESDDSDPVSIVVTGHGTFYQNKNFLFHLNNGFILFTKADVGFISNTVGAVQGAPIYAKNSSITFEESVILFIHNQGSLGGGIIADSTQIYLNDNISIIFHDNSGPNGGALSLYTESRLHFNASKSNIALFFQNNTAQIGGAIYVDDSKYRNIESVFQLHCDPERVKLVFGDNNIGTFSGNQIYGGWIDWYINKTASNVPENQMNIVNTFIKFENENNNQVSSHPIRICLCVNSNINCNITYYNNTIYGKALSVVLVGVGQRYTPVISYVKANLFHENGSNINQIDNSDARLVSLQSACTKISYKINSNNDEEVITLMPYLPYLYYNSYSHDDILPNSTVDNLFQQLTIKLKIHQCPLGFVEQTNGSCDCQLSIQELGLDCDMYNYTIIRSEWQWIGVTYEHNRGKGVPGIIAHQHCPFDYCDSDKASLSIRLENQDEQCAFNREGILCGGCKENLSRVLGTSNCKKCTNKYTVLIAIAWLISGLILVMCLMLLNLTVSVGTINGLTFYANIIRAQHTTFFTPDISNSFLSILIAWLNLDIGIETCLYNGLDSYVITWLQHVYPVYIWLIAAVIIILSHYSSRISKICGKNAVQVLATLFLISYARLLRVMIEVFSFTRITYPNGYKKAVWLVNGNYEFFTGKHIPLVLVTVIFVLISLPYTFTLLTIQYLYKVSHYRILFWVCRLKPFFDAYTGPYKASHRYWTGLLLVARIVLLILFSVNQSNNLSVNLLAIITVSVVLLGWLSSANWVYDSPLNNFLEIFCLSNLGLTSAAVSFNMSNGKNSPATIYLSTTVAFATLVFIVLYHIYRRLLLFKLGSRLTVIVMRTLHLKNLDERDNLSDLIPFASSHSEVNSTVVDLNLPHQYKYNVHKTYELKEPLLDDDN